MITYIKGELCEITDNSIVVEAYGIGYEIMVPKSITGQLPMTGNDVKIYTYQYVKEDALDLYGFLTKDDLIIFKLLITVNGIGPKGALNILSSVTPDELRLAVISGDAKKIQSAPGIGSKTAQKLIIELKDKISINTEYENFVNASHDDVPRDDAIEALVSLGYSPSDAIRAVKAVAGAENMDSEAILKAALKKLAFM